MQNLCIHACTCNYTAMMNTANTSHVLSRKRSPGKYRISLNKCGCLFKITAKRGALTKFSFKR